MTSSGPNSQALNFTHMFSRNTFFKNEKNKCKVYNEGSIMYIIDTHPDFTKFCYIIKLAELDSILGIGQANFTIFVPSDIELKYMSEDFFLNLDKGDAIQIVNSSILQNRLPKEIIQDSPASYFITNCPPNRLFVTNINDLTKLNNNINVIHFDIICTNGIIHVVDKIIVPLKL
jgi:hypothetical protein